MIKSQIVLKEEDRTYFWNLYEQINALINMWHYHREISVEITDENDSLMKQVSPNFYFDVMIRALSHDILMGIARATEKRARKKNDTLSIYGIPKRIPDLSVRSAIEKLIISKEPLLKKSSYWRDNHLAHNNRDFMNSKDPKRDLNNREVLAALDAISEIIHACMPIFGFSNKLLGTKEDVIATSDMKRLFEVLKEGQSILEK